MMTLMFSHVIIYIYYTAGPFQKQGITKHPKLYEGDWYINVNIKHDLD